ncbi:MAG TPA: hypothetical protein VLT91_10960, partial [Rhizomicrobium sp.]|nr:hypothetical protein [Rhizomicrobium sp.]
IIALEIFLQNREYFIYCQPVNSRRCISLDHPENTKKALPRLGSGVRFASPAPGVFQIGS